MVLEWIMENLLISSFVCVKLRLDNNYLVNIEGVSIYLQFNSMYLNRLRKSEA